MQRRTGRSSATSHRADDEERLRPRDDRLVGDAGIVRHRGKVESAVSNARALLELQEREGSFDAWVWGFVGGSPRRNAWTSSKEIPASTPESVALSRELKRRGFRFVGPTICYAFMQATGLVNDHEAGCFRSAGP